MSKINLNEIRRISMHEDGVFNDYQFSDQKFDDKIASILSDFDDISISIDVDSDDPNSNCNYEFNIPDEFAKVKMVGCYFHGKQMIR